VTEETAATSRSPETIQKLKIERSESASKQRAKKPVSQVQYYFSKKENEKHRTKSTRPYTVQMNP